MDRQEQIEILLDHYEHPRHRHETPDAQVVLPGGNPGCGDVVTIFLTMDDDQRTIKEVSFTGEGCTISQAAASILMEMAVGEHWTSTDVENLGYDTMIEILGKEAVQTRPRCATLALGTLKAAVKKYQRDRMLEEAFGTDPDAENEKLGIVTDEPAVGPKPNEDG